MIVPKTTLAQFNQWMRNFKIVGPPPKQPLTWNEDTYEVRDANGMLVAICGPKFMAAIKKEISEKLR